MLTAELENVSFRYPSKGVMTDSVVFDGLSASLDFEGIVGLVGRSGIGKTTLCNLFTGDIKPQSGTLAWRNGHSILQNPQIGFLSQKGELPPWLTIGELWRLVSKWNENFSDHVPAFLLELIDKKSRNLAMHVSGGEARRVEIALVLASGAELVILDEPYQNLDALSARQLTEELLKIAKNTQAVYLIVTHDLHLLSRFEFPILALVGRDKIVKVVETSMKERLHQFEALIS